MRVFERLLHHGQFLIASSQPFVRGKFFMAHLQQRARGRHILQLTAYAGGAKEVLRLQLAVGNLLLCAARRGQPLSVAMLLNNPVVIWLIALWASIPEYLHMPIIKAAEIIAVMLVVVVSVALLTYAERKVIAAMQLRKGPNVVGPFGLLQPFADGVKLLLKETIVPSSANPVLFMVAPIITFMTALIAWAVVPFSDGWVTWKAPFRCTSKTGFIRSGSMLWNDLSRRMPALLMTTSTFP